MSLSNVGVASLPRTAGIRDSQVAPRLFPSFFR